jgi:hypothetical protein
LSGGQDEHREDVLSSFLRFDRLTELSDNDLLEYLSVESEKRRQGRVESLMKDCVEEGEDLLWTRSFVHQQQPAGEVEGEGFGGGGEVVM